MDIADTSNYDIANKRTGICVPMLLLAAGYIAVAMYLHLVLKYEFLESDVLTYWHNSLGWQGVFHRFHVPGYSLMIALLRAISFGKLPPVLLMMALNLTSLLVGAWLVYRAIRIGEIPEKFAVMGACLFGLWPFVGLVFTVHPVADVPAMALLLAGLFALQNSRIRTAALLFGLALIVHKAMWVFVATILIAELCQRKHAWRDIVVLPVLVLPVFILWLSGSFYHGSPTWMISSNVTTEMASRGTLPVLDGIIGTLLQGGVEGLVKGGLVVTLALTAVALMVVSYRLRPPCFCYGMALSAACLILFVALNQFGIWAAVRFSRLLVLPLMWNAGTLHRRIPIRLSAPVLAFLLLVLFSTQFAFAWYMAKVSL